MKCDLASRFVWALGMVGVFVLCFGFAWLAARLLERYRP